ncbi:MAG: methyltransferase domain-containing protein [Chitinispirillaceae bacterium]
MGIFESEMRFRSQLPELMDMKGIDENELFATLDQFRTVNRFFSGIHGVLEKVLIGYMKKHPRPQAYTILDLGAGGCDIPLWIIGRCRRMGQPVQVIAADHDQRVVSYVKKKHNGCSELSVIHTTAENALESLVFDFVISNHFLHHLSDFQLPAVIEKIHSRSKIGYVCNDICRSRMALLHYSLVAPIFFRNSLTVRDGLSSIRKGFTIGEIRRFLDPLVPSPEIRRVFPAHISFFCRKK